MINLLKNNENENNKIKQDELICKFNAMSKLYADIGYTLTNLNNKYIIVGDNTYIEFKQIEKLELFYLALLQTIDIEFDKLLTKTNIIFNIDCFLKCMINYNELFLSVTTSKGYSDWIHLAYSKLTHKIKSQIIRSYEREVSYL